MIDYYAEFIVRKKKDLKDLLTIIGTLFATGLLSLVLSKFISSQFFGTIALFLIAGAWYGAYMIIAFREIEYEYIITNGDIDVDVIKGKRKRKRLLSIIKNKVELIAPVSDENFKNEFNNSRITNIIDATTNYEVDNLYFAIFSDNEGVKSKLLFEPNEKILSVLQRFLPSKVHILMGVDENK